MKFKVKFLILLCCVALFLFTSSQLNATVLNSSLTTDNEFYLYISTSDSTIGTLVGHGNNWGATYSYGSLLTAGVANYIHIYSIDWAGPQGLLGTFTLGDANFVFENGINTLNTDTINWDVNTTGFGNAYNAPVSYGSNGIGPWGYHPGISTSAQWIWDPSGTGSYNISYFSAKINPLSVPAPEPSTILLVGAGLLGMGIAIRKK